MFLNPHRGQSVSAACLDDRCRPVVSWQIIGRSRGRRELRKRRLWSLTAPTLGFSSSGKSIPARRLQACAGTLLAPNSPMKAMMASAAARHSNPAEKKAGR